MHSTENGGPEMLIELAYRLIVQETPFIQAIRNNVITLITPVLEVDGREKQVDTYYFNKKRAQGDARLPLMYWGKYVQHDNNRDGMGQFLELTKAVTRLTLDWRPTILHDLHEAQTYLYSSTGTGPVQRRARSDHRERMVDAGAGRRAGADQARRARRVDLRVLRRLGAQLHDLHRAQPQRRRALLRGAGLRARSVRRAAVGRGAQPRVVPAEPAAAVHQVGPAQQHEHPAVGAARVAQSRGEEPRDVSRELLAEEQARGREGTHRRRQRVGDPGRAAAEGGHRHRGQRPAAPGARDLARDRRVHGGRRRRRRRATTSCAAISRSGRSRRCTSRSRTTRRRIRRRTTTPAGRFS